MMGQLSESKVKQESSRGFAESIQASANEAFQVFDGLRHIKRFLLGGVPGASESVRDTSKRGIDRTLQDIDYHHEYSLKVIYEIKTILGIDTSTKADF